MADAVEIAFHRAARALIPERSHVVVAVSGGGDSVALLHLLLRFASRRRIDLTVAHLDHALRRGSTADRAFVERLAASFEILCVADRRDVGAARRKDESPEEAARRVRRAFLIETATACGASLIATGHTQDDQAETVLMRLTRGAGPSSLAAMAQAGPGPFVRPLLHVERSELRAWLRRKRLRFREDPSNANLSFDRNRVRRLVIPVLAKALNPRAARHIVEAAGRLREDAALLDAIARDRFAAIARRRGRSFGLEAKALAALPHPIAARVARLALEDAGCDPRRISTRHVTGVLTLAGAPGQATLDLPGGIRVSRRHGLLEFA